MLLLYIFLARFFFLGFNSSSKPSSRWKEVLQPFASFGQWLSHQPAGAPLGVAIAGNQAGALQHFKVFGDGGLGHGERLGEFGYGGLAGCETAKDGPPGGVRQRGEGGVQTGCRGLSITGWLHNRMVL